MIYIIRNRGYKRRAGVSLVRAAWERRPEGPAYLLPSVMLLYLAGLCAFMSSAHTYPLGSVELGGFSPSSYGFRT